MIALLLLAMLQAPQNTATCKQEGMLLTCSGAISTDLHFTEPGDKQYDFGAFGVPHDIQGCPYTDGWHSDDEIACTSNIWSTADNTFDWSQPNSYPDPALIVHVPREIRPTLCIIEGDDWAFDYGCRITILRSGVVMLEDGMSPNAAAKLFWDAVEQVRRSSR